jgi:hypothetical protein
MSLGTRNSQKTGISLLDMTGVEYRLHRLAELARTTNCSAWLLLSDYDNRTFAGNDGYKDEVDRLYRWDSTVPNHAAIAAGDIAVIWDKRQLIGMSRIETILTGLETKNRYRCPSCASTKIKRRTSKIPDYACGNPSCKTEFDLPAVEEIGVTTYQAEYGELWCPLPGQLSAPQCRQLATRPKSQHSMRLIDMGKLLALLQQIRS